METATRSSTRAEAPHVAGVAERMGLIQWAAQRFGEVEPGKVMGILRATCFRTGPRDEPATDAEVAALLIVARSYDLNPFTKEIFAFKDKFKGIVPIVSIDGWVRLVNRQDTFKGVEFEYGKEIQAPHGGKKAFETVTCKMYVEGRDKPFVVPEYFDEVYQGPRGENATSGPWQTHPKRMHRHKAYIQCGRLAFGFGGIFDEDEGERIIGTGAPEIILPGGPLSTGTDVGTERVEQKEGEHQPAAGARASSLAKDLRKQAAAATDADVIDKGPQPPPVELQALQGSPTPAPATAVPSIEGARKAIAEASTLVDLNQVLLEQVMKLPPSPERDALMKDEWNVKSQELSAAKQAAAKPAARKSGKPPGTPEILDKLVDDMEKTQNADELNLASDAARGYLWTPAQQQLLNDKYATRLAALS